MYDIPHCSWQVATGIFMNILCIVIVAIALNTTGVPIFSLDSFPDWANTSLLTEDSNCLPANSTNTNVTFMEI